MTDDLRTQLIHHPYRAPDGWRSVQPGVFKGSTVIFPDVATMRARDWMHRRAYTYGLHGTPTSFTLEARLATLEGGRHAIVVPSGLAAIMMVNVALLQAGDEVLLPENVYGPNREMARTLLAGWGITHQLYNPLDAADLAAKLGPRSKLVWLEAAGSVTMEFPDLTGLVAAARSRGVLTALDNTWGAGLAFSPFDLAAPDGGRQAVDLSMHALTKYPSGGGDVLMGSVVTQDEALYQRILQAHGRLGLGVGANDVELVLRGLNSMALRYHAQDASARALAQWLAEQPQVRRVLHPALPSGVGHAHWAATCRAAAGIFSVLLDPAFSTAQVDGFVDALRLFQIGYSWGGPESLAVPYNLDQLRGDRRGLDGHLVRLCIGLEALDDLKADLAQALARLA
jgi:cystathionine beta-lyase